MKDELMLWTRVFVRTSNLKIARGHLADYLQEMYFNASCTCSTMIFPRAANHIIDFWRCRRLCRRRFPINFLENLM